MSANVCPDREQLAAYASGQLNPDLADRLSDHLDTCISCETVVEELERGDDRLLKGLRLPADPDSVYQEPQCKRMLRLLRGLVVGRGGSSRTERKPDPPSIMPGNFRDYRLLEKLGEGGMGAVYKALHTKLNKPVAIKLLSSGLAQDPQRVARFQREMNAVGKLDHPHIVRATDAGVAEGRHFLVMEYVDGLNLSEVVARTGPLRIADACEIIRQAALGLRCADQHGLIHRDIKPSNLMLTAEGQVKILDLGLALFETERSPGEETTVSGQVMGTAEYIAPEQVSDSHSVDIRADIYSLGCTFYKLLTGQAPFAGPRYKSAFDKMMAHVRDPMPPVGGLRADVPEKLAGVLERMLVKDRDLRTATPGRLIAAIEPFCTGHDLAGLFASARKAARAESDARTPVRPGAVGPVAPMARPPAPKPAAGSPPGAKPMAAAVAKDAKQPAFDPYYRWLGISPKDQPPHHYRLLGIDLFEPDVEVIRDAVEQRMAHVRTYQLGTYSAISQRILNELGAAKAALLDPARKTAYDARLRQQLQARTVPVPAPAPKTPAAPLPEKLGEVEKIDTGVETLFAEIEQHHAPQPSRPRRKQFSASRWKRPPGKQIAIAAGSAAAMLMAGIIFYITTNSGTVKIELANASVNVEVTVDGHTIDISGLKQPLRLRVGEHDLHVTSTEFETFAKKFTVRRGQEYVVRVSLEPRGIAKQPIGKATTPPLPLATRQDEGEPSDHPRSSIPPGKPDGRTPPLAVAPFDSQTAKQHQQAWAKYLRVPVETTSSIGMKLVLIPAGEFEMGSSDSEKDAQKAEKPQHHVRITQPFYLGTYEVTQAEYQHVMGVNPSAVSAKPMVASAFTPPLSQLDGKLRESYLSHLSTRSMKLDITSRYPVETLSWQEAVEYCRRLSDLPEEKAAGHVYRLPTEAEWEYACRAGSTTRYFFGDSETSLGDYAWFRGNYEGQPHPVDEKRPNAWGLHGMEGCAWQWCADRYDAGYYAASPPDNPAGPESGDCRVRRGSACGFAPNGLRSAVRGSFDSDRRSYVTGFRVAFEIVTVVSEAGKVPGTDFQAVSTVAPQQTPPPSSTDALPPAGQQGPTRKVLGRADLVMEELPGQTGRTCSVALSPDGRWAAVAHDHKAVSVWSMPDLREVGRFTYPISCRPLAFSPDSRWLAVGIFGGKGAADGSYHPEGSGFVEFRKLPSLDKEAAIETSNPIWAMAFSPNGRQMAVSCGNVGLELWDTRTIKKIKSFSGHRNQVNGVAFTPSGKSLVSGSVDRTVRVWDVETGKEIRQMQTHGFVTTVAVSTDGSKMVSVAGVVPLWATLWTYTGFPSPHWVELWQPETGRELISFAGPSGGAHCVSFLPDGRHILFATEAFNDQPAELILWDCDHQLAIVKFPFQGEVAMPIAVSYDGRFALAAEAFRPAVLIHLPKLTPVRPHAASSTKATALSRGTPSLVKHIEVR